MDHDLESTDSLLEIHEEKDAEVFGTQRSSAFSLNLFLRYVSCFIAGCLLTSAVLVFISNGYGAVAKPSLYLTPIPEMQLEVRMFEWDYTFTGLPSPASNAAWDSILPFGRGYIFVDQPNKYNLPPGELTPNGQIYSVALYHQLHCLGIIRRDYFALLEGVWNNATDVRSVVLDQIENSHNRHCMDYLRQTLECHADLTIEWERTEKDGSRHQVDGMHIPHQCKAKTDVHEFMERQKVVVEAERRKMEVV